MKPQKPKGNSLKKATPKVSPKAGLKAAPKVGPKATPRAAQKAGLKADFRVKPVKSTLESPLKKRSSPTLKTSQKKFPTTLPNTFAKTAPKTAPKTFAKTAAKNSRNTRPQSTLKTASKAGAKTGAASAPKTGARSTTTSVRSQTKKQLADEVESLLAAHGELTRGPKAHRFAGVALGGGKTDKTAVAVVEFFPEQKRVFLRSVRDKLSSKGDDSADESLFEVLTNEEKDLSVIAFDAPLQLPKCFRCELKCPGVARCPQPEVVWMREVHRKRAKSKRPNKMFTPYTERAAEIYLSHELEEAFHPPHAMGSNAAPLTARVRFFERRMLQTPFMEVYPKTTLWRIGMALGIPKSYLRFHRHAVDSDEARHYILKTLVEKEIAFIYQQDLRLMVENSIAFDAFLCALTAFLRFREQTEKRPAGFPKDAIWIDFPKEKIQWF